jgi:hypothetical protein
MRQSVRIILVGVGLLLGALASDLIGSDLQTLGILVISLALAVAGAVVAMRGMLEFLGDVV